jgi:hypothetical protein
MILYYDILAPFESFGIGGKDAIETPDGVFYSHGVRDDIIDAVKLTRVLNKAPYCEKRQFKGGAFDSNGFNQWVAI